MIKGWLGTPPASWDQVVGAALSEDLGTGDLSAEFFGDQSCNWYIEAQAPGILCGVAIGAAILGRAGPTQIHVQDGQPVANRTTVLSGTGQTSLVLSGERTALNFIMLLSGVATATHALVKEVSGTKATITDTRKTIPGLRALQKYAVRCGGGKNHRMGLYDAIMLKDNHIRAAGSVTEALRRAKATAGHLVKIEVECESAQMVEEAIAGGADVAMLDNMSVDQMREIVRDFGDKIILEASGGINLATAKSIAETGVDLLSVGALTHSAPALSFHLEFK